MVMKLVSKLILLLLVLCPSLALINILSEGAISHVDTLKAQILNSQVIKSSILKANSSQIDRVVKIPKGTFYSMPIVLHNIYNVTILIEGKLSASKFILSWPKKPDSPCYEDFIYFRDCSMIEIHGGGRIDGRGYHWWVVEWLRLKKLRPLNSARPHLINIVRSNHFKIHDLIIKNSPCFHIKTSESFQFDLYNLDIKVNTTAQFNLAKRFTAEGAVPTFPLNTDGIDPAGRYYHIWNITVQNYDDVVVPKPSHGGNVFNCTEHLLIQNITIRLGVGLSIGSVPPNTQRNCIRNVTFRNAYFQKPFKAIYLKTNPGNSGSGEISNILYSNMKIIEPIWWAIYLGPQQQKQPLGGGPGCMLYPFDPKGTCATQPRIDIRDIRMQNIEVKSSLLFPIVLRCNETNPCTGIELTNVTVNRWFVGKRKIGFVCENVKGIQNGGHPKVECLSQSQQIGKPNIQQQKIEASHQSMREQIKSLWERISSHIQSVPYFEEDDQIEEHSQQNYQNILNEVHYIQ